MSLNEIDRKELRRRVEKELRNQKLMTRTIFFVVSLLMYLLFMVIAWGMFLAAGGATLVPTVPGVDSDSFMGAMILLSVAGGMGVLFQFIGLMLETRMGERQMRDRAMSRVLSDELLGADDEDAAAREKAKRMMRLTDDGELEEVADEEVIIDEAPQQKQQR